MKALQDSDSALRRLFKRKTVVDLSELMAVIGTSSRMTVFRRLKPLGYLSSFTDAGKYYTLSSIPVFDDFGLWFYRSVGFSKFGTLKSTVLEIVDASEAGMAPKELLSLLKLKMPNSLHNTLRELLKAALLQRVLVDGVHLYTSVQPNRIEAQTGARRLRRRQPPKTMIEPSIDLTIAILVEALRTGSTLPSPGSVSDRLAASGMSVTADQVALIYRRYDLDAEKKTTARPY